jgi:hypothetical protein
VWAFISAAVLLVLTGCFAFLAIDADRQTRLALPTLPGFDLYSALTLAPMDAKGNILGSNVEAWKPVREHTVEVNQVIAQLNDTMRRAAITARNGYWAGAVAAIISLLLVMAPLRMEIRTLCTRGQSP